MCVQVVPLLARDCDHRVAGPSTRQDRFAIEATVGNLLDEVVGRGLQIDAGVREARRHIAQRAKKRRLNLYARRFEEP